MLLLLSLFAAGPSALVFQAEGGDAVVVVQAEPEVGDEPADTVELAVLLRKGERARPFRAGDLLQPAELMVRAGRIYWLASGSRAVRRGAELHLASGRRLLLPFDGSYTGRKATPVLVAPPRCPCSFLDDGGTLHVVDSADEVPEPYWHRARPLDEAGVQVMPMPPPPPRQPEAPVPPPRPARIEGREKHRAPPPGPGEDYYEYVKRITGQRGPQYRVNCIGNDGKPTPCTFYDPGR